jgi:hypothetical protein
MFKNVDSSVIWKAFGLIVAHIRRVQRANIRMCRKLTLFIEFLFADTEKTPVFGNWMP